MDGCPFYEARVLAVLRLSDEKQALELQGEDEDVVGEGEHDEPALRAVVDDVVVHIEILLAEGHCQFVHHQSSVQVFLDDSQPVLGVGEVEERGGVGVEAKGEAA